MNKSPSVDETIEKGKAQSAARIRKPGKIGDRGVVFETMEDLQTFAGIVLKSGLAPNGVDTVEKAMVCLELGAELGLRPMASLQGIAAINGRPAIWGDLMLSLCRRSGLFDEAAFEELIERDDKGNLTRAVCRMRRLPNGKVRENTFSVADAKTAGLWGKTGKSGQPTPWVSYPARMLQVRARSPLCRDLFGDVLLNLYTVEEVRDFAVEDILPGVLERLPQHQDALDALTSRILGSKAEAAPAPDLDNEPDAESEPAFELESEREREPGEEG